MPESNTSENVDDLGFKPSVDSFKDDDRKALKLKDRLNLLKRFRLAKLQRSNNMMVAQDVVADPLQGPPPEPPRPDPTAPFGPENQPFDQFRHSKNSAKKLGDKSSSYSSQEVEEQAKKPVSPERIAQKRTSEFAVRLLAGLAVQLAVRSRTPERQSPLVRKAEQGYMSRLWDSYTKRALRVG